MAQVRSGSWENFASFIVWSQPPQRPPIPRAAPSAAVRQEGMPWLKGLIQHLLTGLG